jgi:gas vesicle protein
MAKSSSTGKKIAIGALVAGAAGFLTGILTAPKSGKETRQDIKQTANNVKREAERKLKELQSELNDLLAKAQVLLNDQKGKAQAGLDVAVERAQDAQKKVKETISALKSGETDEPELKKAIAEAKKARDELVKYFKK